MKRVLVCPLNWGLGHATRCVPIIRKEIAEGNEVTIAADGFPLRFLKKEFPELTFVESESYPIKYSKGNSLLWQYLKVIPFVIRNSRKEHRWLKEFAKKEGINKVISDNRFGLWNEDIHSVYMTHQVMAKMPKGFAWFEKLGYSIHKSIIEKYTECWVPDVAENGGFTGDLAHKYPMPKNAKYIGVLSRFDIYKDLESNKDFENVVILSGVEPQRSIFEKRMTEEYKNKAGKTVMIVGKPDQEIQSEEIGQITKYTHLQDEQLIPYLKGCKKIVCRAGYSTVMDLETLGVEHKAIYYPTPGQTEQEYLAIYLNEKR